MMSRILVAMDGSALSERSVPYAWVIAKRAKARLIFVQSVLISLLPTAEAAAYNAEITDEPRRRLEEMVYQARQSGLRASWSMPNADAGPGILQAAKDFDANFVMMASHRRSDLGRLAFGSVSDWVLRHASIPVFIVPERREVDWADGLLRILVPLDGSKLSERAIRPAGDLARAMAAEIILMRAIEPDQYDTRPGATFHINSIQAYLDQAASQLTENGIAVTTHIGLGHAPEEIRDSAEAFGVNLIAMATHARNGVSRLVLGSETNAVLRETPVPLLLVGPVAAEVEGQPSADAPAHALVSTPERD